MLKHAITGSLPLQRLPPFSSRWAKHGQGRHQAGQSHCSADPSRIWPIRSSQNPSLGARPGPWTTPAPAQAFLSPQAQLSPAQPRSETQASAITQLSSHTQRAHLPLYLRQILTPSPPLPGTERLTLPALVLTTQNPQSHSRVPRAGSAPPAPPRVQGTSLCNFRARRTRNSP